MHCLNHTIHVLHVHDFTPIIAFGWLQPQRSNMSTWYRHRAQCLLGRLPPESDNCEDKRFRWMIGHLARADDNLLDKRRVWDRRWHALKIIEKFDYRTAEDQEYRDRRNERFPEFLWDDEATEIPAGNHDTYVLLIYQSLQLASQDFNGALSSRNHLLEACRNAEAAWRREAMRLNPKLVPSSWSSEVATGSESRNNQQE